MTVMVEMPSALRQFADNQDELDSDGKNVEEVLADLCGRFPELKQNLYEAVSYTHLTLPTKA